MEISRILAGRLMVKRNMPRIIAGAFFLMVMLAVIPFSRAEVLLDYESRVMLIPQSLENLSVKITAIGKSGDMLAVNCSSALYITCPASIAAADGVLNIFVSTRWVDPSVHNISFDIGGSHGEIEVIISNAPHSLLTSLDTYQKRVYNLSIEMQKLGLDETHLIRAGILLHESHILFQNKKYSDINEKIAGIEQEITLAYQQFPVPVISQTPEIGSAVRESPTDAGLILYRSLMVILALAVIAAVVVLSFRMRTQKSEKVNYTKDLSKLHSVMGTKPAPASEGKKDTLQNFKNKQGVNAPSKKGGMK